MPSNLDHLYTGEPGEPVDGRWQRMWSHREHLLKVARRRSMSVEDAEDAVHEAMLRAVENPHIDDERLGAWLTTVTMRLCVDRYRQLNREAEVSSRSALVAPEPVPVEEVVCDRAEAKWLERRSRSLPARQAEALRLKSEDLDVGQVATHMGLSYEATESLLARARRAMRSSLAGTLAAAVWLVRGRPGAGGVQTVVLASTAMTLTVLGIALPYSDEEERPRPPHVSRAEAADEPSEEHDREKRATPGRPTARPVSGPTQILDLTELPLGAVALVPALPVPSTPEVPDVPVTPALPSVPAVPEVSPVPAPKMPSQQSDVRPPAVEPVPGTTAEPADAETPGIEPPDGDALPTEVEEPLG